MPDQVKWCPRCNTLKNVDKFYKNRSRKDGLGNYCKKCTVEDNVNRRREKNDREREHGTGDPNQHGPGRE